MKADVTRLFLALILLALLVCAILAVENLASSAEPARPCRCALEHRYSWKEAARVSFKCADDSTAITCSIKR